MKDIKLKSKMLKPKVKSDKTLLQKNIYNTFKKSYPKLYKNEATSNTPTEYAINEVENTVKQQTEYTTKISKRIIQKKYQTIKTNKLFQKNIYNQNFSNYGSNNNHLISYKTSPPTTSLVKIKNTSKSQLEKSLHHSKIQMQKQMRKKMQKQIIENSKKIAKATKETVKLLAKIIKAIIHALAEAITAIIATIGSTAFIVIVILIVLFASVLISPFGSLFASTSISDPSTGISKATSEIATKFDDEIEKIKDENSYDDFEINGEMTNWQDVLTIFSIKIYGTKTIDIIDIDDENKKDLENVFWDMNNITYELETIEYEDESETILYIYIENKTCEEMADLYNFSENQREILQEIQKIN